MTYHRVKSRLLSWTLLGSSLFILPQVMAPQTAQATVADGVYAYERGLYKQALQEWLPYAALGNTNALYNLGQLFRLGRGVEINYKRAEEYYLRAAGRGHVGAQRNVGTLYYFGRLGKIDHIKAFHWLLKSAISGDVRSQLMVGTMYFNGEATEKNSVDAYAWVLLASDQGLHNATDALRQMAPVMAPGQIEEAKTLSANMTSRQLSPDDGELMVNNQGSAVAEATDVARPAPEKAQPAPVVAETPVLPAGIADNYRIQLASYRNEALALEQLDIILDKHAGIVDKSQGTVAYADLGEKGVYYRVQLKDFGTKSAARDLCRHLKENDQACYVVKTP